jgi:hypothetical protein
MMYQTITERIDNIFDDNFKEVEKINEKNEKIYRKK